MEYVTLEQMTAVVPEEYLQQAMDDDGEGEADSGVWAEISLAVADAIEGPLARRYRVPFAAPLPPIVRQAARVICAEMLYLRRGMSGDKNPWTQAANDARKQLEAIGDGKAPLSPALDKAAPSGSVISEPARTHSAMGRLTI